MHDLPLAEELDGLPDVGVVAEAEDVVVGHAGLLLGGQILVEVGDHIPLDPHVLHVKGHARGGHGVETQRVIHEVGGEGGVLDLLLREVAGELVQDGGDHLQMGEFFRADVGQDANHLLVGHAVPLVEIAHGGGQLAIRAA